MTYTVHIINPALPQNIRIVTALVNAVHGINPGKLEELCSATELAAFQDPSRLEAALGQLYGEELITVEFHAEFGYPIYRYNDWYTLPTSRCRHDVRA